MRMHSDKLMPNDFHAATHAAGMRGVRADVVEHGSRSRRFAYDVHLTGTSSHRPNGGTRYADSDDYAATWDEWGMFLAYLFDVDHFMVAGTAYNGREDFRRKTCERFDALTAPFQHQRHRWEYMSPRHFGCDCGAEMEA